MFMNYRYIFNYYIILIVSMSFISGCVEKKETLNLSIAQEPDIKYDDISIKVAIASVISPKESYTYYEDLIKYISRKIDGPVKIVQRRNYSEVNLLLKDNQIDFAFICSGAYIDGSGSGIRLLVAPVMNKRTVYNSYIIVPVNRSYNNISDLRNKRFAFTDPLSNTGKLYPEYLLYLMNETPESFFGEDVSGRKNYFFTYSHDNSIIAVAEELADGAAVDSLVYDYMRQTKPEIISQTRIIEISPPFGIPPVVVSKDIDPFLEQRLKDIFLNMDKDEEGQAILSKIIVDRFVSINDSAYDTIRDMRKPVK